MLFFLSNKYFGSGNCLKEVRATLDQKKPLVLVHEQQEDKGGGPLDMIKAECRDNDMRAEIFNGRTPITWHRVSYYQNLTLKLIATEMLQYSPHYRSKLSEIAGADAQAALTLVLPGEVNVSKLALTTPLVLWCSAGNPGAAEVAQELESSMAMGGAEIQVVDSQPDMQAVRSTGGSAFMLLYLNEKTWVEQGEVLERDVRAARAKPSAAQRTSRAARASWLVELSALRQSQAGPKIVMVHENDPEKGGCEFSTFFRTTPQELIEDGIYRCVASILKSSLAHITWATILTRSSPPRCAQRHCYRPPHGAPPRRQSRPGSGSRRRRETHRAG